MPNKFFSSIAFVLLAMLLACTDSAIKVSKTNFEDEIALQQNLKFTFSSAVVTDSMLNIWDTVPYIQFTPAVRGKFRWTATDELVFSPETGFAPATAYKAELGAALGQLMGQPQAVDKQVFSFHTPYLALSQADLFWNKSEAGQVELRLNMLFNYKLNPAEVANGLKIEANGGQLPFEVRSSMVSEKLELILPIHDGMAALEGKQLSVSLRAGTPYANGRQTLSPLAFQKDVPARGEFSITRVQTEFAADKAFLRVYATQALHEASISGSIHFEPAAHFNIEPAEHGFIIRGNFDPETSYELTIDQNLQGVLGGKLSKTFQQQIAFGQPAPGIDFVDSKAIYLSSAGQKNVALRIVNVAKVQVTVYKIYENNIHAFMRTYGGYFDSDNESFYENQYYNSYANYAEYGDVVMQEEVPVKSLKKQGDHYLLNLDLGQKTMFKGIFVVRVNSTEDQWTGANTTIAISDVGLIARETTNNIVVFANSIVNAAPLGGVELELVSANNQFIYKAKTDDKGVAVFENIRKKAPGFRVQMLTARYQNDFSYLFFPQTKIQTARYEVDGLRENPTGYQAFIYGDRDIYRPGETVNLNTVLRNNRWQAPAGLPVKLKVLLPNGQEYMALKGKTDAQGAYQTKVKLQPGTVTGTYHIEAYAANDVLLNTYNISVEEFMPDRIKVDATTDRQAVRIGESLTLKAVALNLFGPPAAGRNYQVDFSIRQKQFAPKGYEMYNFGLSGNEEQTFENMFREGKTDATGTLAEAFSIPQAYAYSGLLAGRIFTTVFDETGRPVNRVNNVDIVTQPVFFGIREADRYIEVGKPVRLNLVSLNKDGQPTPATATVQVVRYEWHTAVERGSGDGQGRFRYVSQRKEVPLNVRNMTIKGQTDFSFMPPTSGEYEVRVFYNGSNKYVKQALYAYSYGATQASSFEVDKEGQVSIALNKDKYQVGENAQVLLKTPFAGKVLITVERDRVFEHFYVNTDKKSASFSLPIKAEYLPNVYITATLFRPLGKGAVNIPLMVGHGYAPLMVEKKETVLPLQIVAAAHSESNKQQTITVRSKPESDIQVTVAVVDEGILQLKNYRTPSPHAFFFQKRALEVNSYDVYARVFPELYAPKAGQIGGDGYDLAKRVNPLPNKRVKLVSYWSGVLKTNARGEARYTVQVPQFSGDLRIMAVAYKGDAFGSANANMKVADPVVISSALPRFLSPTDEVQVPVTLTNITNQPTTVTASLQTSGAVAVLGAATQTLQVAPHSEVLAQFSLQAAQRIGAAQVKVVVQAGKRQFVETTDLTVRPVTSLIKISSSGRVVAGQSRTLDFQQGLIPASAQASLLVSRSPLVQFAENLTALTKYPYGCMEQTISRAFPQLYFRDLVKATHAKGGTGVNPDFNVQEAIRKVQQMQLYNGGLAYWPGDEEGNWWVSAYGAHFLWEARKAGFEVNELTFEKLLGYLTQQTKAKQVERYTYYDATGKRITKSIVPKEMAYSLYMLALAGRPDAAMMNYYKANPTLLAIDSRYLLAAAYLQGGDNASFRTLLPAGFAGERAVSTTGGSFYSYIRDEAVALNALLETDYTNPQVQMMARHLAQQLKKQTYLSTQENAFALLALGKLAKKTNAGKPTAQLTANGQALGSLGAQDLWLDKNLVGKQVSLNVGGSGAVYYFQQAQGLSTTGTEKEADSFLKVRRAFYDRQGKPLTANSFKQNDLVVVKISLSTTDNSEVSNVVITDMLPAGFEIENPRLGPASQQPWVKDAATAEHFDIRDDRINLFTKASGKVRNFYYTARAVSKGRFKLGPVSADAMYNGEYHSYNGSGVVVVR